MITKITSSGYAAVVSKKDPPHGRVFCRFGTGVRRRVARLERERSRRTGQRPSAAETYHLGRCPQIKRTAGLQSHESRATRVREARRDSQMFQ